MMRTLTALAFVVFVGASRVHIHGHSGHKFGASCEDLQTNFGNRLTAFQEALDSMNAEGGSTRTSQMRQTMRGYGILRTLRRARTCSWLTEADSEDMAKARSIAQSLMSSNPCAAAARSEMQTVSTTSAPEAQVSAVTRTMAILTSDSCEASEIPDNAVSFDEETMALDEQELEAEAEVQDGLDEMIEMEESEEGSFVQLNHFSLFRLLAVVFILVFLLLACTYVAVGVLFLLTWALGMYAGALGMTATASFLTGGMVVESGVSLLFPISIAGCAIELFHHVLPQIGHHLDHLSGRHE